jgi:hypothetical protein
MYTYMPKMGGHRENPRKTGKYVYTCIYIYMYTYTYIYIHVYICINTRI